jgi:isoleucyl-tRNA synthetase
VRAAYEATTSRRSRALVDFCQPRPFGLYFDIRRDSLYCDRPDSAPPSRGAHGDGRRLRPPDRLAVPARPFTTEEAWTTRFPEAGSNSFRVFPETPEAWANPAEAERWAKVQAVTSVVTGALEIERREKRLGAALEAAPRVSIADAGLLAAFDGLDPAEVFRTSQATLVAGDGPTDAFRLPEAPGVAVEPLRAEGQKCARSWRILPEVGSDPRYPELSLRDADAVAAWDAAR